MQRLKDTMSYYFKYDRVWNEEQIAVKGLGKASLNTEPGVGLCGTKGRQENDGPVLWAAGRCSKTLKDSGQT